MLEEACTRSLRVGFDSAVLLTFVSKSVNRFPRSSPSTECYLGFDPLVRRVARVGGHALDRVEHDHGELGARLVLLQIERDQRHAGIGSAAVAWARLVQHVRER